MVLKDAPLPADTVVTGVDNIIEKWRQVKLRAVGKDKAIQLVEATKNSIGIKTGFHFC